MEMFQWISVQNYDLAVRSKDLGLNFSCTFSKKCFMPQLLQSESWRWKFFSSSVICYGTSFWYEIFFSNNKITNQDLSNKLPNLNFKEILSPSETKNQRLCHFWCQYEVYEDIISDLTYKNFLHSETKRFLMISQIFSKIISFLCFYSAFIRIFLLYLSKTGNSKKILMKAL